MTNWNDPAQACAEMRRLDTKYGTKPGEPMHHDTRCGACSPFIAEHFMVIHVTGASK